METLRFLMVTTHFPPYHLGGDAVFVDYLTSELVRRGHEAHVFFNPAAYKMLRGQSVKTSSRTDDRPQEHPYSSPSGRIDPFIALSLGLWGRPKKKLAELVRTVKPDVVHWHNSRGFIGEPFAVTKSVSLYTVHDYTPVCPRSNLLKPHMRLCNDPRFCTICCMKWKKPPQLWRIGKKRVLRYSDGLNLISPSEFVAKRLESEGVSVHGVLRGFVPDLGEHFQRSSSKDDVVFYLGLLEKHKGLLTLLDAFAKSRDRQQFRLYIVGEGTLREDLRRRVASLGLSGRVSVPGFLSRPEVEAIRKDAVAQIVPSVWFENAPSVILEAFSLGIPAIASDIGGLPEIATPDSGSKLFRPGDADELAISLESAWQERHDLDEKRKRARDAYTSRYRPDTHIAAYLRMIKELSPA